MYNGNGIRPTLLLASSEISGAPSSARIHLFRELRRAFVRPALSDQPFVGR